MDMTKHGDHDGRQGARFWRFSQELLVVVARDGTIEAVNPAWRRLLGYADDEIVGRKFIEFTHPADLDATLAVFAGVLERPLVTPHEYRLRHKDGSWRWFGWTGAFQEGRVLAAGRDQTHGRRRETALQDAEDFTRLALRSVGGVGIWTADLQARTCACDAAIADLYGVEPVRAAGGVPVEELMANVIRTIVRD